MLVIKNRMISFFVVFCVAAGINSSFALAQEKEIQVREREGGQLKVSLESLKDYYEPGEAIRFKIRGNESFFLYLFTISERTGKAYMILPNSLQNKNKYSGRQWHHVPNKNVEFFSNKSGEEKVVYVASKRYLNWDTKGYSRVGDFLETSTKSLDDQIQKQIVITRDRNRETNRNERPARNNYSSRAREYRDDEFYVGEYSFYVGRSSYSSRQEQYEAPASNLPQRTSSEPVIFLGTDKDEYYVGEQVKIVIGSDTKGYLHLFTRQAGRDFEKVTTKRVDGNALHKFYPTAARPKGLQYLLVVFSEDRNFNKSLLGEDMLDGLSQKGLVYRSSNNRRNTKIRHYVTKTISVN